MDAAWDAIEVAARQFAITLRGVSNHAPRRAQRRSEEFDMGLAWAMHELRGPLLGVRAVVELLLQRNGDAQTTAVLRDTLREVDHLVESAGGLLAWAVGARELEARQDDLVRVVEEALASCRLETGQDRIAVSGPPHAYARIDAERLHVAIVNLLRNALAFANPGTKVQVAIENEEGHLVLSVRNEGSPIPVEERWRIFEPFVRGRSVGRPRGGSGLGLYIARRVVEAHGGRIWVEPDTGTTTFRVSLPLGESREPGREPRRFAS